MKFLVEAYTKLCDLERFRKQRDGSWRGIYDNKEILETDGLFRLFQTERFMRTGRKEMINGWEYTVNNGKPGYDEILSVEPVSHRTIKPKIIIPTKEDLEEVIRSGDDTKNNYLTIDLGGRFILRDPEEVIFGNKPKPIAVYHQCFCAGMGVIGMTYDFDNGNDNQEFDEEKVSRELIADKELNTQFYKRMLAGWLSHLKTGKLKVAVGECFQIGTEESQLVDQIYQIVDNLQDRT
ncbi:hypothetical protein HN385_00480 [archaeon]|jgi:hypothetical protein|nr:hypothetical protein [archaeon]MBT3451601.1 hypothetical protein [archaeon]MBT6869621.1 hypothetical protein [archaeon]MBT7192390.1 hypothetical protein [archaeon]MBT7380191.1 hypothetical protein [archaeon]